MTITTIGVDLAKNSFQLHGIDRTGRTVLRKKLSRSRFLEFFANLPACTIGMEACGGAHHWARELTRLGHTVRLMPPQYGGRRGLLRSRPAAEHAFHPDQGPGAAIPSDAA